MINKIAKMEEVEEMAESCEHLALVKPVQAHSNGCEECLKMGDRWLHLRLCLECGHVGCCDSSKNKHATKHFHATQHAIIKSFEPGEDWGWCFVDEIEFEPETNAAFGEEVASLPRRNYRQH